MNRNFQRLKWQSLLLFSFILLACGKWGWEHIESDHEPTLNVFAMIIIGEENQSFVRVHQTIELDGSDFRFAEYDTLWYGPDSTLDYSVEEVYKSAYLVDDATVYITDGIDTTYFTNEPPEAYHRDYRRPAYYDTSNTFHPDQGSTYYLYISSPDGRKATGSVTIPPLPHIYSGQVPDTVYNKRTFTIPFRPMEGNVHLRIKTAARYGYWGCGMDRISIIPDNSDTTWTSRVINCSDNWYWEGQDELDSMHIQLQVMDKNYYQYFIKNTGGDEYVNFFLGGEGNSGPTFGIEGGFGLFGAMSTDAIDRVYVP